VRNDVKWSKCYRDRLDYWFHGDESGSWIWLFSILNDCVYFRDDVGDVAARVARTDRQVRRSADDIARVRMVQSATGPFRFCSYTLPCFTDPATRSLVSSWAILNPPASSLPHRSGAVQSGGGGQGPPLVIILAPLWPPMKFMIKHNLPLVCGGSLWQYRFVHPQLQLWPPHFPPPNVNPRTATVTDPSSSRVIVCCHLRSADSKLQWNNTDGISKHVQAFALQATLTSKL